MLVGGLDPRVGITDIGSTKGDCKCTPIWRESALNELVLTLLLLQFYRKLDGILDVNNSKLQPKRDLSKFRGLICRA